MAYLEINALLSIPQREIWKRQIINICKSLN